MFCLSGIAASLFQALTDVYKFCLCALSEKARLQAEAKAAEEAQRKAEAEAAAEAKRKRELEREAARQALQKVSLND